MVIVRQPFVYSSGIFTILVYGYTYSQGPFIEENVGQLVTFKKYKYITCVTVWKQVTECTHPTKRALWYSAGLLWKQSRNCTLESKRHCVAPSAEIHLPVQKSDKFPSFPQRE